MYVIIVGGSLAGAQLAKVLVAEKADVVIIEKDKVRAEVLANSLDALVIHGDAKDTNVLKESGIHKADALIALTSEDDTNLMVCQLAKRSTVEKVMSIVHDPENEPLFVEAGVIAAISTTEIVITEFKNHLTRKNAKTLYMIAGGKIEFLEVYITENSPAHGKMVSRCGLGKTALIVSIERDDKAFIPEADEHLKENDLVGVVLESGSAPAVLKTLVAE